MELRIRHKDGIYAFIGNADERMRQEEFPSKAGHEEDRVGNWREHPQLRTRNACRSFHLSPGVNERIIANSLTDNGMRATWLKSRLIGQVASRSSLKKRGFRKLRLPDRAAGELAEDPTFRLFSLTFPDSRFIGHLPKTQIDLYGSVSAFA